jgi:hypothetical protein
MNWLEILSRLSGMMMRAVVSFVERVKGFLEVRGVLRNNCKVVFGDHRGLA